MLLADDADYEVLEHYRLLLSWDHEKKRLVFTPPMKDSTGSFDMEGDDIDFESMQGGSRSIQKGLDLDNEDLPDFKSNPPSPLISRSLLVWMQKRKLWRTHLRMLIIRTGLRPKALNHLWCTSNIRRP